MNLVIVEFASITPKHSGKRVHTVWNILVTMGTVAGSLVIAAATRGQVPPVWKEDVSHAAIPSRPASGKFGEKSFVVTTAQLHKPKIYHPSRKDVQFLTLELTSVGGTPGVEIGLAIPSDGTVDGKTYWRRNMQENSGSVATGSKEQSVSYPPFQAVWIHGKKNPNFTLMNVFEMKAVSKYSARIEFGKPRAGKIPGRIYFCGQPDSFWKAPKSVLAGEFNATILPPGK